MNADEELREALRAASYPAVVVDLDDIAEVLRAVGWVPAVEERERCAALIDSLMMAEKSPVYTPGLSLAAALLREEPREVERREPAHWCDECSGITGHPPRCSESGGPIAPEGCARADCEPSS